MTATEQQAASARRARRWPFTPLLPRRSTTAGRRPPRFLRIGEEVSRRTRIALGVTSIATPLLAWVALVALDLVDPLFLPSPAAVLGAGRALVEAGTLQSDTQASVQRIVIGFGIAVLISVPLGLAMGTFPRIQALFEPGIALVRYMPATAFVPLLLFWLGIDERPKVALIVIGTVFFNTLMTANVVWSMPAELVKVAFTLGASTSVAFRKVIVPYALPGVIDAMRVNLAAAWNLIVVAEILAAQDGLGLRIARAQKFLQIDTIFFVLIVIGLLGLASDLALRSLRNRVSPWANE